MISIISVTERYWRKDGKCGRHNRLSNGAAGQCDPDGHRPCCSDMWDGECGTHCYCDRQGSSCTNYTRIYREWEESGGTQKWRYDGQCGRYSLLPDGTQAQCNPEGDKACCHDMYGKCGSGEAYCSCKDCVNYTPKRWRNDGWCGDRYTYLDKRIGEIRLSFPLSDGAIAQCDPDGENPCCGGDGKCGNSPEHCHCLNCVDYRPKKWRDDGRCGKDFPLPDGTPSQCDPDGWKPCCSRDGRCGTGLFNCSCNECVSYARRRWRSDRRCRLDFTDYSGFYKALDGDVAECNPFGDYPMCDHRINYCVEECSGEDCLNYRLPTNTMENKTCYAPPDSNSDTNSSKQRNYQQNRFKCDNGECVNYNQLCNRIDDCGDRSDELDCPNYMTCNYTKLGNPKFVHVLKICDGIIDCFDMSDECNSSCGKEILGSWVLKITCCFMGLLAIVFNSVSLFHRLSSTINDCPTEKMMISKMLMSLIGSGDFLIGVYLIVLFIYDSLVFGSSYCENQPEWLTGTPCMILGVISTVGSQLSLFSMTSLSCIIMYGVVFQKMTIPSPVSRKSKIKAASLALTIQFASLAIAVTPLIPALEDFFVQGMHYGADIWLLTGFPDKDVHEHRIDRFNEIQGLNVNAIWAWRDIEKHTDRIFSHHGDLQRRPVHFYGNDGICLFKYFVRRDVEIYSSSFYHADDTRKAVVRSLLIVNLVCFVIIAVCYIAIICKTRMSTRESGQSDNPDRLRENDAMQNRIIFIIVTDFLCWVPFTIIGCMHNYEYINASTWYTPFAMTLLPINSVINPLLYDKILFAFIMRRIKPVKEFITCKLREILVWVESTRLFQITVRQIGFVREFITVRLATLLAWVESTRLFQITMRQIGFAKEFITVRLGSMSVRESEDNAPPENDLHMEGFNH